MSCTSPIPLESLFIKHLWSLLLILKPSLFLSPLIPPSPHPSLPSSLLGSLPQNLPMLTHLSLYLPWLPLSPLTLSLRIRVRLQHPPELRQRKKELCERYIIHRRLNYLRISIGIHFLPILGMICRTYTSLVKGRNMTKCHHFSSRVQFMLLHFAKLIRVAMSACLYIS